MRKRSSKRKTKKVNTKSVLRSKAFTVFAMFGIIVIAISLTKEIIRKVEISRQISDLSMEITDLEQQNAELNDLMQYFNSSTFQEKEARKKLGLRESGETVVVIPDINEIGTDIAEDQTEIEVEDISNVRKWKRYFFNIAN